MVHLPARPASLPETHAGISLLWRSDVYVLGCGEGNPARGAEAELCEPSRAARSRAMSGDRIGIAQAARGEVQFAPQPDSSSPEVEQSAGPESEPGAPPSQASLF
jgi:hypothetical protein